MADKPVRALTGALCLASFIAFSSCAEPVHSAGLNRHGERFEWRGFTVLNNQWGRTWLDGGRQSIEKAPNGGIAFTYQWRASGSRVKGYPAIIAGWHFGDEASGGWLTPFGRHGLPTRIGETTLLNSSFTATLNALPRTGNLAWDVWLFDEPPAGIRGPSAEVMVWPWHARQRPLGAQVATVFIWNASWSVHIGSTSAGGYAWPVITFVRNQPTLAGAGDLLEFVQEGVRRKIGSPGSWIVGVEFGAELIAGEGVVQIAEYQLATR